MLGVRNHSEQQFVFACPNIAALFSYIWHYRGGGGGTDFPKMFEQPHNCRRQTGDMEQGAKLCSGSLHPTEMYERLKFVSLRTNNTQLPINSN